MHANPMGHYVNLAEPRRASDEHDICPVCGQRKSARRPEHRSDLCLACQRRKTAAEIERREEAKRRAAMNSRRPRYDAALDAGWPFEDLRARARAGDLPTWEEIRARRVSQLIRGYCKGMGN